MQLVGVQSFVHGSATVHLQGLLEDTGRVEMSLQSKKLGRFWWIIGDEEFGPCGPYDTRREAEEDCIGMTEFYHNESKPGFVSCDSRRSITNKEN